MRCYPPWSMEVMCEEQRGTSSKSPLPLKGRWIMLGVVGGYEREGEALVFLATWSEKVRAKRGRDLKE